MLAPVTISTDALHELASEITEIERSTGLSRTLAIGQLILERFFSGNVQLWREKSKHKQHSIRRLAELPECPLGKSALSEAVGVYVVSLSIDGLHAARHIKASHVVVAAALPKDECLHLLGIAESERWSVKRMREKVACLKRQGNVGRATPEAQSEELASVLRQLSSRVESVLNVLAQVDGARDTPWQWGNDVDQLARARELCKALSVELSRVDEQIFGRASSDAPVRMRGHKRGPRRALPDPAGAAHVDHEPDAPLERSTAS